MERIGKIPSAAPAIAPVAESAMQEDYPRSYIDPRTAIRDSPLGLASNLTLLDVVSLRKSVVSPMHEARGESSSLPLVAQQGELTARRSRNWQSNTWEPVFAPRSPRPYFWDRRAAGGRQNLSEPWPAAEIAWQRLLLWLKHHTKQLVRTCLLRTANARRC